MTNIERFESLLTSVNRDGINRLMEYIKKSDFYTAPASTRFHSCHEGGLLEHSLNVYDCLLTKRKNALFFAKQKYDAWSTVFKDVEEESIIICSLLHDICKTYYYGTELKNKKVYSEHGTKRDSKGSYDWESVPAYTVDDKVPYGHGEKSVMIIEEFIKLKPIERYAIRWHMGFTEPKESWNTLSSAIKKYPFILALHESDLEATYLLEKEE